jgi:hypothetical protein
MGKQDFTGSVEERNGSYQGMASAMPPREKKESGFSP